MLETYDFRIPIRNANLYLPGVGVELSPIIRKVVVTSTDPIFSEIGRLETQFRSKGKPFFLGFSCRRTYSTDEIEAAELFLLKVPRAFEPAGEELGTTYDSALACPKCGTGERQTSELFLESTSIPGNTDIARTIAGEVVVSQRTRDVLKTADFQTNALGAVRLANRGGEYSSHYWQLVPVGPTARVNTESTLAGQQPFDRSRVGACACGNLIGLNLLSELALTRASLPSVDLFRTCETVGTRRGLLRPSPFWLVVPRLREAILAARLRGFEFEIANVV